MTGGPARGPAPVATYRVQVTPDHDLDAVAASCRDLARLGVSHLYLSPVFEAAPGSTHGYDVTDPTQVRAALGGAAAFERLRAAARGEGLGLLIDIVPNHMATAGRANPWWWALLATGPTGPVDGFFDVAGDPVVVPVLGAPLEDELAAGTITVETAQDGSQVVRYHEHELPVRPDDPGPTDDVAAVIERQHHRPGYWRHGGNYRRFFDIDGLIGVRVEDPSVFAATHALALEWCRTGAVDGLRVDHVDGLADPTAYLQRLADEAPGTWLLVEKVLAPGESLPEVWPVDGTTGYEFAGLVDQLAVDPRGEVAMTRAYQDLTGDHRSWPETVAAAKEEVVDRLFGRELDHLRRLAARAVGSAVPEERIGPALRALLVSHDRYRTYVPLDGPPSATDERVVAAAAQRARVHPEVDAAAVDALVPRLLGAGEDGDRELAIRFQQLSGPVMAKGVEDTASYRYLRLVSLNEVGGDPGRFGAPVETFHQWAAEAMAWPHRLLAGTTHDTKRGEDVRARLDVLAQVPDRWRAAVERWTDRLAAHRPAGFDDARVEYLLWQTLVGAWPIGIDRLWPYLEKAVREAKDRTSWLDPDQAYEADLRRLAESALADDGLREDVAGFVAEVAGAGATTALAGLLLRLTAPGVPDLYQGSEDELRSLVDPDNRRPVDGAVRRRRIHERSTPRVRLVQDALAVRRAHAGAFGPGGAYEPIDVGDDALAFVRGGRVATVVPRFPLTGRADVDDVALGDGWEDRLEGLPVRLLVRAR